MHIDGWVVDFVFQPQNPNKSRLKKCDKLTGFTVLYNIKYQLGDHIWLGGQVGDSWANGL